MAADPGIYCPDCGRLVATHEFYRDGRCPVAIFRPPSTQLVLRHFPVDAPGRPVGETAA